MNKYILSVIGILNLYSISNRLQQNLYAPCISSAQTFHIHSQNIIYKKNSVNPLILKAKKNQSSKCCLFLFIASPCEVPQMTGKTV